MKQISIDCVFFLKERIILGSDYPFPLGELDTGALIESTNYDDDLKVINLFHF